METKSRPQMKGQKEYSQKEINVMEASTLSDIVFQELVIGMLK